MRDRLLLYYEMNASANALRAAFRWYECPVRSDQSTTHSVVVYVRYASRSSEGCDWEQFQELCSCVHPSFTFHVSCCDLAWCSDLDLETSLIKDKILPMFASIQQQSGVSLRCLRRSAIMSEA